MTGMDRRDGRPLEGLSHLRQSLEDILTTPLGSRVMRRDYGSGVAEHLGESLDRAALARIRAAAADAIDRFEPRLRLARILVRPVSPGHVAFQIEGTYLPEGRPVRIEGVRA